MEDETNIPEELQQPVKPLTKFKQKLPRTLQSNRNLAILISAISLIIIILPISFFLYSKNKTQENPCSLIFSRSYSGYFGKPGHYVT